MNRRTGLAIAAGSFALMALVMLLVISSVSAAAVKQANAAERAAKAQLVTAIADRDATAEALTGCAAAYATSSEVTEELRDEAQDILRELNAYVGSYGTYELNSDDIAADITATNTKQLAIDSTGCEYTP